MFLLLLAIALLGLCTSVVCWRRSRKLSLGIGITSIAALVSVGVGLFILSSAIFSDSSESGERVAAVEWLDQRASDISYYRANDFSGILVYEFSISPEEFQKLALERGWAVRPIVQKVSIERYSMFINSQVRLNDPNYRASVASGFEFERRSANSAGITVVYDAAISRAFVSQSSR